MNNHAIHSQAIITVGNELMGDDGVGPAVYRALSRYNLPDTIQLIDGGTGGMSILHMLRGYEHVIIVDCGDFGGSPGEIALFTPDEVVSLKSQTYSLHDVDLITLLEISKHLGEIPATVHIVAIQPRRIAFNSPLSPEVAAAIPGAVTCVLALIQ